MVLAIICARSGLRLLEKAETPCRALEVSDWSTERNCASRSRECRCQFTALSFLLSPNCSYQPIPPPQITLRSASTNQTFTQHPVCLQSYLGIISRSANTSSNLGGTSLETFRIPFSLLNSLLPWMSFMRQCRRLPCPLFPFLQG